MLILWDGDKMQNYCDKVATRFCKALISYEQDINIYKHNIKQIFTTLSHIVVNKGKFFAIFAHKIY